MHLAGEKVSLATDCLRLAFVAFTMHSEGRDGMKVRLEQIPQGDDEVIIRYREMSHRLEELLAFAKGLGLCIAGFDELKTLKKDNYENL